VPWSDWAGFHRPVPRYPLSIIARVAGGSMWPMATAMGKRSSEEERAPAGAAEIIDHCKRLCRPLTRAEALTTTAPHGCRPRAAEGPPILMADGSKETVSHNHARFRRGGSQPVPVSSGTAPTRPTWPFPPRLHRGGNDMANLRGCAGGERVADHQFIDENQTGHPHPKRC
jgi:hypothetical protein